MAIITTQMDIGSGRTIAFGVKKNIADYFGITEEAVEATPRQRQRKAYSFRRRPLGVTDEAAGTEVRVERAVWYDVRPSAKAGAGRPIKFPTGQTTQAGNERFVIIRVPSIAVYLAVVQWTWDKFTNVSRRPNYIISDSGVRYPVRNFTIADVNPGEEAGTETTPETTPTP